MLNQNWTSIALLVLVCSQLTACNSDSSSEGTDKEEASIAQPELGVSGRWQPELGVSWHWQLEGYDSLEINKDVDVFDIDLFEGSEGGKESIINTLKSNGKRVICYFSAGTREDWRPDANNFSDEAVIADGEMQDWPGEVWLDINNKVILNENIKPIMQARLDLAQAAGCDAVEPDNVDGYTNTEETKGIITYDDQLDYNKWLANAAHSRGLSIGLKNDIDQLDELVNYFDFAVNEQCYAYGNECIHYEDNFLKNKKAVFVQEYYEDGSEGETSKEEFKSNACPYYLAVGISALWKEGFNLDGKDVLSCSE